MNSRTAVLALVMGLGLGLASAAQADSGPDGHRGDRQWRGEHRHEGPRHDGRRYEHRRDHRYEGHHHRDGDARHWERRREWQAQHHAPRYYAPQHQPRIYNHAPIYGHGSHYGAPHYRVHTHTPRYWAGGYVPHHYRAHRYWVNDWHTRQLWAPPYGHQWVQTDTGEILLIALATGLIAHALLGY